ncbi:MAG TPA: Gfo/Idh/MocA family oxidoreductase [Verrucomicrobiae bacterium]|jgi:predicted dehydrogenase|nr:Gfo/Idh/MocA family oxidoreductase [Verrucomicrobiae bacterium]
MRLKTAVVGVGHLGKEHARLYKEIKESELIGICDSDASKKAVADTLGVPFFQDFRKVIPQVEAVSIATPTSTHYAIAREFLAAGVHTLIEKPITMHLADADDLIELSRINRCALQVGHIERHNPGLKRVGEIAKNIRFFEIHRLGPFNPRINDCGVVLDLMIHDLDIVLSLVQSEIASFDAVGINVLTPFEDIANARIKFKNGAVADVTASRLTPEKQRKIRIFQEDAYISLDYGAQAGKIFRKQGLQITQENVEIEKAEPLKEELSFFLREILAGKSPGNPDTAARDALALALDIVAAIKNNNDQAVSGLAR